MATRVFLYILVLSCTLLISTGAAGQNMESLKTAVVRISNATSDEVGTGFIVKIESDRVFILTSSHVVAGSEHPEVFLYNLRDSLSATVKNREVDDLKGLALLELKLDKEALAGLKEFSLMDTTDLQGGEGLTIIGFPGGTSIWTVTSGTFARIEGRDMVFSGSISRGNSGGPVILNGRVIGLITDIREGFVYGPKSESIKSYANGLVKNLIKNDKVTVRDEFCEALTTLINASTVDFYPLVGQGTNQDGTFKSKLEIPGTVVGYVVPKVSVYYYLMVATEKGKTESQFYASVSKVKTCLPDWEEKEDADSTYRYHRFRKDKKATVAVYYNPVAQHEKYYYLIFSVNK